MYVTYELKQSDNNRNCQSVGIINTITKKKVVGSDENLAIVDMKRFNQPRGFYEHTQARIICQMLNVGKTIDQVSRWLCR